MATVAVRVPLIRLSPFFVTQQPIPIIHDLLWFKKGVCVLSQIVEENIRGKVLTVAYCNQPILLQTVSVSDLELFSSLVVIYF